MNVFTKYLSAQAIAPTGLSSQLDRCHPGDAVFYRLADTAKAQEVFKRRLAQSQASLVFVCGSPVISDSRIKYLNEDEFNRLQSSAIDHYYPVPKKRYVAVTGTNGKTSTVHLLMQILMQNKRRVLSIGTLGTKLNGTLVHDDGLTTPGLCELRRSLYELQDQYDDVVMEVSSHALEQKRTEGIFFDVAGWTNLTQDHLDYHKSIEAYFQAKLLIAKHVAPEALFVADEKLLNEIHARGIKATQAPPFEHTDLIAALKTPFASANLGLAIRIADYLGATSITWSDLSAAPGRFQLFEYDQIKVIIDYAHTPDALENACRGIKLSYPQAFCTVIFGCGGDRDKTKRPLMGQVAAQYADHIVVTSDNPRGEEAQRIIEDILVGIKKECIVEVDRKKAIEDTLKRAKANEVILIAGKGHETYQEIKGVRYPFDDAAIVQDFWKKR